MHESGVMKLKYILISTVWTVLALVITLVGLVVLLETHPLTFGRPDRLPYYKFYLDAFKVIGIGGLVAVVSTLAPQILSQARADFDRLKESRSAYSNAKTGIDYLPLRLCALSLPEACALIQQAHIYKHQAELYEELEQWLRRRHIPDSSKEWGDRMYARLATTRDVLQKHAGEWNDLRPNQRFELLEAALTGDGKDSLYPG
jgi:hypothetical protein